jgi:CRP-like cAMP-binding protein
MISPEMLRRFALFAGLDAAVFKDIAMLSEEVVLDAGDWLFHDGDEASALYLIIKGKVDLKLSLDAERTRLIDVSTMVEGDVVGWSALIEPYTYTLDAIASTQVQLAKLDAHRLIELMEAKPEIGFQIMRQLAKVIGNRLTDLRVRFVSLID